MVLKNGSLILSVLLILAGCQHLRLTHKRDHILNRAYAWSDTLYLNDFVLCNTLRNEWNLKKEQEFDTQVDLDSVYDIFKSSLKKIELPIKISNGENKCDSIFRSNWRMRVEDTKQHVHKAKNNELRSLQLIPVIHATNFYERPYYIVGGVPGGGYYVRQTILRITIFILDGEEIIYLRSGAYFSESYRAYNKGNTRTNLTQEHWDNLVELVLRDYVKRLR